MRMDGPGDRWLLLHGTPLTLQVWDGVAACLTRSGPVSYPDITPAVMSAMAGRLPRATLRVLPGAAHVSPFNDPAALARLISVVRARE